MEIESFESVCSMRHLGDFDYSSSADETLKYAIRDSKSSEAYPGEYEWNYSLLMTFCSNHYHRQWLMKRGWTLTLPYMGYRKKTCEIWTLHIPTYCKLHGIDPKEPFKLPEIKE